MAGYFNMREGGTSENNRNTLYSMEIAGSKQKTIEFEMQVSQGTEEAGAAFSSK